jgi:hypothetical protein
MSTNPYLLSSGSHKSADDGRCAMEWVAYLAGEKHSDQPVCVSPMLKEFCIRLNDALPDDQRQRMRPYLARTIGTAGDRLDESRRWLCADWLIREYTPTFLELVPSLKARADALRVLPPVLAAEDVKRAMVDLSAARSEASAARAAARAAVGAAAWDAVGDAAWAAAGAAAWDAARDAAWAENWDAARAAARAAAGDALVPSVLALQNSVLSPGGLLDRMLPTEVVRVPVVSEWREVCGIAS